MGHLSFIYRSILTETEGKHAIAEDPGRGRQERRRPEDNHGSGQGREVHKRKAWSRDTVYHCYAYEMQAQNRK